MTMRTWAALGLVAATALALLAVVVTAYKTGHQAGTQEVTAKWSEEKARIADAQAEEQMKARQRENALRELNERLKLEHRREVNHIARNHALALERLRERPEARADSPSGLPDSPDAGTGCTGRGLAKMDAELLTGYAASAARLQSALNACQAAYNEVRQSIIDSGKP